MNYSAVDYDFKSIIEVIELVDKYKKNKKRPRKDLILECTEKFRYNVDIENLAGALEPLKKLNQLVGMDSLKRSIIDQVLFFSQDLNTNEMMHTCLTGPPGVGKTTLGMILAELYCSLGFLKTNNFKIVSRPDLIAGYLGQTALKTQKVLKESLGGVLFIDEAYSLGNNDDDSGNSYSKECIDTINKFLSENTTDFVMIIAGYKEELDKCFFSLNKGLERRFPWRYDLQEYTPNNLKDIFEYQVCKNGWYIDSVVTDDQLNEFFKTNKELFKNNGGDTLILFDKAKIVHSRRVFGKPFNYKKFLSMDDISKAVGIMKENKNKKVTKEPPIGMYI
jgi:SpoVK/Ycf46/Vps4 family AAA+-type ATPase